jgi:predicted nucleotide-binding protein (sugar kinase/HSP70/actin superfamily)
MGDYYHAFKSVAELIGQPLVAPPITKKTIELGFKHSPEAVCIPFKYNLGNYIEALDAGAEVLVQAGGGCRFGHYAEVQEEILRKLGYKFEFAKLNNSNGILGFARDFKKINPAVSYFEIFCALLLCLTKIICIDSVAARARRNVGFQKEAGSIEAIYKKFLAEIDASRSVAKTFLLRQKAINEIKTVELDKPADCLRVGVVGELYMLMEPFANFYLEKKLAQRGIEVHRFVTVSTILKEYFTSDFFIQRHLNHAKPYLKHHLGAHGTESVARAQSLIKKGFDGIIHVKPFGCMPEVSAMSALANLSRESKTPILYFSFDSQTSESGIETRIEAFCDMLYMKKAQNSQVQSSKFKVSRCAGSRKAGQNYGSN